MHQVVILISLVGAIAGVYQDYRTSTFGGNSFAGGRYGGGFGGGRLGGLAVSRRDEGAKPTSAQEVYDLITDTLTKANQGIKGSDLAEAAAKIEAAALKYLESNGLSATEDEVKELIKDIATKLTVDTALSGLFADPLSAEASHLDAALQLLQGLVARAKELEDSGKACPAAFSAIVSTARAIQKSVGTATDIITFVEKQAQNSDVQTRDLTGHLLNKRKGKLELDGYYKNKDDYKIGGKFTYNWGRK